MPTTSGSRARVDGHAEQLRLPGPGAQQHQLLHPVDPREVVGQRAVQQAWRPSAVDGRGRGAA